MQITAVLGFAAVSLTLIAVPGPDWAYVLAAGARDRAVLPAVAGLLAGYALITVAVAVGVGALVAAVPAAMLVLTVAGAGYLIHLGVRTLRRAGGAATALAGATPASGARHALRGMAASGLNPKGLLIFLSILPQFAHASAPWPLTVQLAVLGGVFILIAGLFYLALGFAATAVLGARPGIAMVTTRIAGAAMILVGVVLLVEAAVATSPIGAGPAPAG